MISENRPLRGYVMLIENVWRVALTDPSELEFKSARMGCSGKKAKLKPKCSRCPKSNLGSFEQSFRNQYGSETRTNRKYVRSTQL